VDEAEDGSGVKPPGAVAVPDDLMMAWLLLCEQIWTRRDKLGATMVQAPGKVAEIGIEVPALVREMVRGYMRLAAMG
jgi:hypothetical protein